MHHTHAQNYNPVLPTNTNYTHFTKSADTPLPGVNESWNATFMAAINTPIPIPTINIAQNMSWDTAFTLGHAETGQLIFWHCPLLSVGSIHVDQICLA